MHAKCIEKVYLFQILNTTHYSDTNAVSSLRSSRFLLQTERAKKHSWVEQKMRKSGEGEREEGGGEDKRNRL